MVSTAPSWPMTPSRIAAWTRLEKKACRKAASASASGNAMRAGDGADRDAIGAVRQAGGRRAGWGQPTPP